MKKAKTKLIYILLAALLLFVVVTAGIVSAFTASRAFAAETFEHVHTLPLSEELAPLVIKPDLGKCPQCGIGTLSSSKTTIKKATCTDTGLQGYPCTQCDYVGSPETIEALGHDYQWETTTQTYKCTRCSDVAETVELPPAPVKEGYTFIGWFFDKECTQSYDGRPIYADTVLYAGWKINTYTVTFDTAGGNDIPAQTVDWNTSASLPTPERIGYKFLGWYLPGGTQYEGQPIKEDVTLTAHWERVKCTVTFYVDGVFYTSLEVDYGTPLVKAAEAAGLFSQNLYAYDFVEGGDTDGDITQVKVTGDMTVQAGEPSAAETFEGFAKKYWLYGVCGVAGAVALGLIGYAIFGRKRKE